MLAAFARSPSRPPWTLWQSISFAALGLTIFRFDYRGLELRSALSDHNRVDRLVFDLAPDLQMETFGEQRLQHDPHRLVAFFGLAPVGIAPGSAVASISKRSPQIHSGPPLNRCD